MSSTPLFDTIARRSDETGIIGRDIAPSQPAVARSTFAPAPAPAPSATVPSDLVAAIDEIPARMIAAAEQEFRISDEQRALVEALGDSFIRVVVDSLATELERIVRDRVVRS
jgi:hypothetical protein